MPTCNQCHKPFSDFQDLAVHISSTKGHRKGRVWATKYLLVHGLSFKNQRDMPTRGADNPDKEITEFGEENRRNMQRSLSGQEEIVLTVCPMCHKKIKDTLPVEFVESPDAWRIDGVLTKLCVICRRR